MGDQHVRNNFAILILGVLLGDALGELRRWLNRGEPIASLSGDEWSPSEPDQTEEDKPGKPPMDSPRNDDFPDFG